MSAQPIDPDDLDGDGVVDYAPGPFERWVDGIRARRAERAEVAEPVPPPDLPGVLVRAADHHVVTPSRARQVAAVYVPPMLRAVAWSPLTLPRWALRQCWYVLRGLGAVLANRREWIRQTDRRQGLRAEGIDPTRAAEIRAEIEQRGAGRARTWGLCAIVLVVAVVALSVWSVWLGALVVAAGLVRLDLMGRQPIGDEPAAPEQPLAPSPVRAGMSLGSVRAQLIEGALALGFEMSAQQPRPFHRGEGYDVRVQTQNPLDRQTLRDLERQVQIPQNSITVVVDRQDSSVRDMRITLSDPLSDMPGRVEPEFDSLSVREPALCGLDETGRPYREVFSRSHVQIIGKSGCVAGETRLYLPRTGEHARVDDLATRGEPVEVLAWTPTGCVPAWTDGAPFVKGVEQLYEVRCSDGATLRVTSRHRFLTPRGWRRLADVHVGQRLVAAPDAARAVTAGSRSGSPAGAPRFGDTPADSPDRCRTCPRCDGRRPRRGSMVVRAIARRRAGALARTRAGSLPGARVGARGCIPPCPRCSHRATTGSRRRGSALRGVVAALRSRAGVSTRLCESSRDGRRRLARSCRTDTSGSLRGRRGLRGAGSWSTSCHREVRIRSIRTAGVETFYDLTVPGPANYIAEGLVHHNSGKSSALWWFLRLVAAWSDATCDGIDLTRGPAFSALRGVLTRRAFTYEDAVALLRDRKAEALARIERLGVIADSDDEAYDDADENHIPTPEEPQRFVALDEFHAFASASKAQAAAEGDKSGMGEGLELVEWFLRYSRKAAVTLVMSGQGSKGTDTGTTTIRDLITIVILFACDSQDVLRTLGKDARDAGWRPDLLLPAQDDNVRDAGKCYTQSGENDDSGQRRWYRMSLGEVRRFARAYRAYVGDTSAHADAEAVVVPEVLQAVVRLADEHGTERIPSEVVATALGSTQAEVAEQMRPHGVGTRKERTPLAEGRAVACYRASDVRRVIDKL